MHTQIQKIGIISMVVFLAACAPVAPKDPQETHQATLTNNVSVNTEKKANKGEQCGGKENIICNNGLSCLINHDDPLASGVCEDDNADDRTCDKAQNLVCGEKNRLRNGYQNKCFAEKKGAILFSDGFCKKSKTIINNCTAKVTAIERCPKNILSGFEFDGKTCVKKYVRGCDAEIPFKTKEACQNQCL